MNVRVFVLQLSHQLIGRICPYLGEGPFGYISECHMAPELVRVNRAVPGYASYAVARRVPAVHSQEFEHILGPFGIFAEFAQIQVGPVGVIIYGQHFLGFAP